MRLESVTDVVLGYRWFGVVEVGGEERDAGFRYLDSLTLTSEYPIAEGMLIINKAEYPLRVEGLRSSFTKRFPNYIPADRVFVEALLLPGPESPKKKTFITVTLKYQGGETETAEVEVPVDLSGRERSMKIDIPDARARA